MVAAGLLPAFFGSAGFGGAGAFASTGALAASAARGALPLGEAVVGVGATGARGVTGDRCAEEFMRPVGDHNPVPFDPGPPAAEPFFSMSSVG